MPTQKSVMAEIRERAGIVNTRPHLTEEEDDSARVAERAHKELNWIRNSVTNAQKNIEGGRLATALSDMAGIAESLAAVTDAAGLLDASRSLSSASKSIKQHAKKYLPKG